MILCIFKYFKHIDREIVDNQYQVQFNMTYDKIVRGEKDFDDWSKMKLQKGIVEGKHYVLVSTKVWDYCHMMMNNKENTYKIYMASPTIYIFVVKSAKESKNILNTPYEFGYPDLNPITIKFVRKECGSMPKGILISIKITGKMLYKYISDHYYKGEKIILHYRTPKHRIIFCADDGPLVPEDDSLLSDLGISQSSILTADKVIDAKKVKDSMDLDSSYPLFYEEYFEGVESEESEEDKKELEEEEKKRALQAEIERKEREKQLEREREKQRAEGKHRC